MAHRQFNDLNYYNSFMLFLDNDVPLYLESHTIKETINFIPTFQINYHELKAEELIIENSMCEILDMQDLWLESFEVKYNALKDAGFSESDIVSLLT